MISDEGTKLMESTGFPYPDNVALASYLESVVRVNGGVPATIGILNGVARVGLQTEELIELTASAGLRDTMKVSRRDLGFICGLVLPLSSSAFNCKAFFEVPQGLTFQGLAGKKMNGGTTIAGTMVLAQLAGIKVFATGGLGGVHRNGESTLDISADLTELGKTPVTVISSGCKSFLDIPRTLEYLETQGVGVATFADGREGKVDFPAFYTRESGVNSPMVLRDEEEAAAVISKAEMDVVIAKAIRAAEEQGASGKDNTPFILNQIKELTSGKSVKANRALIESNVLRGTKVAVELAKLELAGIKRIDREDQWQISQNLPSGSSSSRAISSATATQESLMDSPFNNGGFDSNRVDILVAGSLAVDFSCDYAPFQASVSGSSPQLHTSNPAIITQRLGGVGNNIATAAHRIGADVCLCSVVGDDLGGRAALATLADHGLRTDSIQVLPAETGMRTAQYMAVNDTKKDLMLAMADMSILESVPEDFDHTWKTTISTASPKWLVVDANWNPKVLRQWISVGKVTGAKVAFEPVSIAKSARLFTLPSSDSEETQLNIFPTHLVDITTPNAAELATMYSAARDAEYFHRQDWWAVIDALGISSAGARNKLVSITNVSLVDQGIPQQSIQMLPFIPCILTKLGPHGVLMTELLRPGDERLTSPDTAPYILSRSLDDATMVGGVYMRLFPSAEVVPDELVVSVNGVGDTFLGVLIAGLVSERPLAMERLVEIAQRGSVMTLKSKEAVSLELGVLKSDLVGFGG
ncbi:MAG: hypothetical protein M1827_004932 [Pycnora praestabilis]|nr:MAG: hypothetical protein M1827_004932 [Pycnora praestabilis]